MSSIFYTRSELTAPWSIALPAMRDCLMFHMVNSGQCSLEVSGRENLKMRPGDFSLVPHGEGHILSSKQGLQPTNLFDIPREQISERYEILRYGGGGEPTMLICGAVRFSHPAARHLIELLPKIICIDSQNSPQMGWINSTLQLMAVEASDLRPGGETVITRLADILVIQAIRRWIEEDPTALTGWLGALQDKQIGHSILMIHRNPEHKWTVESLAKEAAMSRSAYAARFKHIVGESPMQYVARWRMSLAMMWIKEENTTFDEIAGRLGYDSEAAFNRAFKRIQGISPGVARKTEEEVFDV